MSDLRRTIESTRAQQANQTAEQQRHRQESRDRVAAFITLMRDEEVAPIAVYDRSERDVMRDDGIFRRKMVYTGQKVFKHVLLGHGWPTEVGNDSDYDPRILTIMDDGETYMTSYLQDHPYPDTPELPYVIHTSKDGGPYDYVSSFMGDKGEQRLAYTAIRLIDGQR